MTRDEDWKRIPAMAGVDEDGGILPPPPGAKIGISPCKFWKTREYGMTEKQIPGDAMEAARKVVDRGYDEGLLDAVARAIMAERESATKAERDRCANVCEGSDGPFDSEMASYGRAFAGMIRGQP